MNIQTRYNYEKIWRDTLESEILVMIEQELGDVDAKGILSYVKEAIAGGKIISVGSCKLRLKI